MVVPAAFLHATFAMTEPARLEPEDGQLESSALSPVVGLCVALVVLLIIGACVRFGVGRCCPDPFRFQPLGQTGPTRSAKQALTSVLKEKKTVLTSKSDAAVVKAKEIAARGATEEQLVTFVDSFAAVTKALYSEQATAETPAPELSATNNVHTERFAVEVAVALAAFVVDDDPVGPPVDSAPPAADPVGPPVDSAPPAADPVGPPIDSATPAADPVGPPVDSAPPVARPRRRRRRSRPRGPRSPQSRRARRP